MYIPPGESLRNGHDHPKNEQAQKELKALGYDLGNSGPNNDGVDGNFGDRTEAAVRQFQRDNGLEEDGIIGPQTGALLNEKYCEHLEGVIEELREGEGGGSGDEGGGSGDEGGGSGDEGGGSGDEGGGSDDEGGGSGDEGNGEGDDEGDLTDEQKEELRRNAEKWKNNERLCRANTAACTNAVNWVRENGKFAPAGSGKSFERAMALSGGGSLAGAFRVEKLLGILAQESSFGTNLGPADDYRGPFQLGRGVVDDFNRHNPDNQVTWPDDIDGSNDIGTAARVAAWYLAYLIQQFTFKPPITDADEANKFALAAYNGGIGTIQNARKAAGEAGDDPNSWDDVKEHLDGTDEKKKEIKEYVDKVREYERLARELECV